MSQVAEILELLKTEIRKKGLTYKELSLDLGVSESTLKRWFSQHSFGIERLDDICRILKVDLAELYHSIDREHRVLYLNEEQELELAANENLFKIFYLAIEGRNFEIITQHMNLSDTEVRGLLIRLDHLGLIELHAEDRVVPLVNKSVRWLSEGPLHEKYGQMIRHDFMNSAFEKEHEKFWLESGFVSQSSLDVFSRKLDQLVADYRELIRLDQKLDSQDKMNITFFAAHRPWVLPVFHRDESKE